MNGKRKLLIRIISLLRVCPPIKTRAKASVYIHLEMIDGQTLNPPERISIKEHVCNKHCIFYVSIRKYFDNSKYQFV